MVQIFGISMTPAEWLTGLLGVLGLAGGAIGFFAARRADAKAGAAARDASEALTKSAAAAERAAAALEEANRLYAESRPKPEHWEIQWKGKDRLFLINRTGAIARDLEVIVGPSTEARFFSVVAKPDGTWSSVEAGAALECLWHDVDQSRDQADLTVTWVSATSLERIVEEKRLIRP